MKDTRPGCYHIPSWAIAKMICERGVGPAVPRDAAHTREPDEGGRRAAPSHGEEAQ